MTERPRKTEPQFLSGWKEIANYLDKGVRTVQRYERQLGLPVRRPAGNPWGSVVATRAELDAWVKASPIREVFRLSTKNIPTEFTASADDIKRGLAKMMRLRDQMLALRAEVRDSVQSLRKSVHDMQGELNQYRFRDGAFPVPSVDQEDEKDDLAIRDEFDLLTLPTEYPKAG
jgi:hypothetical protein